MFGHAIDIYKPTWISQHRRTSQTFVSYAFSMTDKILPFWNLLKPKSGFYWDDDLNRLFEESKLVIGEGVWIFDKTRSTCLATDWSEVGIGFWLFQKHCSCPTTTSLCCPSRCTPKSFDVKDSRRLSFQQFTSPSRKTKTNQKQKS